MYKLYRYGFPFFAAILLAVFFLSKNIYVQAAVIAFIFWAVMELAGRMNDAGV